MTTKARCQMTCVTCGAPLGYDRAGNLICLQCGYQEID